MRTLSVPVRALAVSRHFRYGHMRPSCRFRGWFSDHLPGRAGRRPPSASMASPMRAVGLWNPKAIRVMTLILVFTDSIRPLLSPWSRVAWMLWTAPGSLEAVTSGKVGAHGIQEAASR